MYSTISQAFNMFGGQPSNIPSAPGRMDTVFCNNDTSIKLRKYLIDLYVFLNCYIDSAISLNKNDMQIYFNRLIKNKNDISTILKFYFDKNLVSIYLQFHQEYLNISVKLINAIVHKNRQQVYIYQDHLFGNSREMAHILMQMNKRYYSQRKVEESLRNIVEQTRVLAERKLHHDTQGFLQATDNCIDQFNLFADILAQGIVRVSNDKSNGIN